MSVKQTSAAGVISAGLCHPETEQCAIESSVAHSALAGIPEAQEGVLGNLLDQLGALKKEIHLGASKKGTLSGLFGGAGEYISKAGMGEVTGPIDTSSSETEHGFLRLLADLGRMSGRLSKNDHESITGINGRDMLG